MSKPCSFAFFAAKQHLNGSSLSVQEQSDNPIQRIQRNCANKYWRKIRRQISSLRTLECQIGKDSRNNQLGGAEHVPCNCQYPRLILLRNLERDVPVFWKQFRNRQQTNDEPRNSQQHPNHTLAAISVNDAVRAIVSRNSIGQCGIATRHPDRHANQQYGT